jgi:hypothetical protein
MSLFSPKERPASFGALKRFELLERKERVAGAALKYRAVVEKETLRVMVALDKAGKIRGVGL